MLDQAFAHCQIFFTAAANADGPYFSPTVAIPPLREAMDHWLGMPLPSQLPNPNQKFLKVYSMILIGYKGFKPKLNEQPGLYSPGRPLYKIVFFTIVYYKETCMC